MVAGNVLLNVFMKYLFTIPAIEQAVKSQTLSWPAIVLQILLIECLIIVVAMAVALLFQSRKRDLI